MKKILLYNSGGGLGDSIQLFTLILSLQKHFKSSEFFYLGAHENHFQGKLKEFNINIKTLDLGLKYFGFRWWHFRVAKKRFIDLEAKKRKEKFVPKNKKKSIYQELDKIHDRVFKAAWNSLEQYKEQFTPIGRHIRTRNLYLKKCKSNKARNQQKRVNELLNY